MSEPCSALRARPARRPEARGVLRRSMGEVPPALVPWRSISLACRLEYSGGEPRELATTSRQSGGATSDSTIGDGAATATIIGAAAGGGGGKLPNLCLGRRTPGLSQEALGVRRVCSQLAHPTRFSGGA